MAKFCKLRFELAKEDERRFIHSYREKYDLTHPPIFASPYQDQYEGWDVMLNQVKYDVKGRKSIRLAGRKQHKYIWIEVLNEYGNPGWLHSDHHTAMDLKDSWLILKNSDLKAWVLDFIPPGISDTPTLNCMYTNKSSDNKLALVELQNIILNVRHKLIENIEFPDFFTQY